MCGWMASPIFVAHLLMPCVLCSQTEVRDTRVLMGVVEIRTLPAWSLTSGRIDSCHILVYNPSQASFNVVVY